MYPNMYQAMPQRYEIVHVQGEAGARSLMMAPNSNAILLDDTAALIWLVQVDGNGNKSLTPYDIAIHKPEPQVDFNSILQRLERIEGMLNESNTTGTESKESGK